MTDLVVDSSVVIKWFVHEEQSIKARAIRAAAQTGIVALRAPDLMYAELGNIVWKKQILQGLAATDARRIVAAITTLPIVVTSTTDLLAEAYELAATYQRTVYDALYVALSVRAGCSFVTADQRLVNSVQAALPRVIWLGHWTPPADTAATQS